MSKRLVIVESPAKARTIGKFLGDDFVVTSSIGHIRDLPNGAKEVPEKYKGESWASLGVNVEDDFTPIYVVNKDKRDHVRDLKKMVNKASELLLATDEDREGEAIAWHLLEELKPKVPVKRMVFHEITKTAIQHALDNPRELDTRLVDAQEARRILDRLFGYEVSPVLWKKVATGLSAGRVQSVATRIVVQRERERMEFVPATYWDLEAIFGTADDQTFVSTLVEVDGKRLATGKDFGQDGKLKDGAADTVTVLDEAGANALVTGLAGRQATVRSVEAKPYRRRPYAPFTTSTLQQEAGRKLRFSAANTMRVAQRLYENGYITYMRTDSTTLSGTAINAARSLVTEKYGKEYLPDKPRTYTNKSKNAQEAHEAIRPAGETFKDPQQVRAEVKSEEFRLYELIWQRTVASQMEDAVGESVQVRVAASTASGTDTAFAASGRTITFPGFLKAYVEGSDDPEADLADRERYLPTMAEGDGLATNALEAKDHTTQPPARYTEASLVKKMEELGVGRPSTYASIIGTITNRGYVWKKGQALIPSFKAFAVVELLERHFDDLVDYAFTAKMEDDLDLIANGEAEVVPWLKRFYFGEDAEHGGLKQKVTERLDQIDARAVNSIPLGVDKDGQPIVARVGRYGPYLERGEDRASIPDEIPPDELTIDKAVELLDAPSGVIELGTDEETGLPILARNGRFGPYVSIGLEGEKPVKTSSLFKSMSLETITLEEAKQLLQLPRHVGMWTPPPPKPTKPKKGQEPAPEAPDSPEDAQADADKQKAIEDATPPPAIEPQPIEAANGRYGPYIKCGTETRSLDSEEQLLTITEAEAIALLSVPKTYGRQRTSAAPLKELGVDPISEKPMVVKNGRFGEYVTDGETNASLRKGDTIENLTDERASELLQMRRERMAATGGGGGRKKAAKKKSSDSPLVRELKKIEGVGPAKQKEIKKAFSSLKKLNEASVDELADVKGIGPKLAAKIKDALDG